MLYKLKVAKNLALLPKHFKKFRKSFLKKGGLLGLGLQ